MNKNVKTGGMNVPAADLIICPLNWGIGHATRCIPIIKELIKQGFRLIVASDGQALSILQKEFPSLPSVSLPGYDIQYHTNSMPLNMAWQLPKMLRAIRNERKVVKQIVKKSGASIIVSDCRYGCYDTLCHNVFISHQLNIKTAHGWATRLVNAWQDELLKRFQEIWVPDYAESPGLSGSLSHPPKSLPTTYLGPISRMQPIVGQDKAWDIVAVISGPEPARSRFEAKVLSQLSAIEGRHALVCGRPESETQSVSDNVHVFSFLSADALCELFASCRLVVSRSGYTSLLDYEVIGCHALLVPTPGQTEQEYLAKLHAELGKHQSVKQPRMDIAAFWKDHNERVMHTPTQQQNFLPEKIMRLRSLASVELQRVRR